MRQSGQCCRCVHSANPFCDYTLLWVSSPFICGICCFMKWRMFVFTLLWINTTLLGSLLERTPWTAILSKLLLSVHNQSLWCIQRKGFHISLSLNLKTEEIRDFSLKRLKCTYRHLRKLLQLGNFCEISFKIASKIFYLGFIMISWSCL